MENNAGFCIFVPKKAVKINQKIQKKMQGKLPDRQQGELFRPILADIIDKGYKLVLFADTIDWQYFEKEFILSPINLYNQKKLYLLQKQ
ncbi:MAG: hypothetical protein LBP85_06345 [Prevotellaceae bacterium]|nr:hypothetical protein [Prevotellaceae bacterium]